MFVDGSFQALSLSLFMIRIYILLVTVGKLEGEFLRSAVMNVKDKRRQSLKVHLVLVYNSRVCWYCGSPLLAPYHQNW